VSQICNLMALSAIWMTRVPNSIPIVLTESFRTNSAWQNKIGMVKEAVQLGQKATTYIGFPKSDGVDKI
jgi:hypothetical protein